MKVSLIRFLLCSSLGLLLTSCGPSPYAFLKATAPSVACLKTLEPDFNTVLYNTSVDVVGFHLSGLLLVKKMNDGSTRVVFTNEMGLTIFDFEFFENEFRVLQCMKKLNRTVVLRALRKDITMLLQSGYDYKNVKFYQSESELYFAIPDGTETTYLITDKACSKLKRIENTTKRKKKVIVNLIDAGENLADSVYIAHQGFEFNISLKKIQRSNAPE